MNTRSGTLGGICLLIFLLVFWLIYKGRRFGAIQFVDVTSRRSLSWSLTCHFSAMLYFAIRLLMPACPGVLLSVFFESQLS